MANYVDTRTLAIKLIQALAEQQAINAATPENVLKKYG